MTDLFSNPDGEQTTAPVTPEQQPEVTTAPQAPSYDDHLKNIVTEDGRQKYADIPTALDGLKNAQDHISNLTKELAEAKAKAEEAESVKAILDQLESKKDPVVPATPSISKEDVSTLVQDALTQKELQAKIDGNAKVLRESLVKQFGDETKAREQFTAKAQELGMTYQELQNIALNSPALVMQHFSSKPIEPTNSTTPVINTEQIPNNEGKVEKRPVGIGATSNDLINSYRAHAIIKE